jgi:thioredoxin-like negative regulator of GroEL
LLAIAVDDTEEDMQAWLAEGGWTFPVMVTGADDVAGAYGVRAVPTVVLIDSEGWIVETLVGGTSASGLSALIDGLTH